MYDLIANAAAVELTDSVKATLDAIFGEAFTGNGFNLVDLHSPAGDVRNDTAFCIVNSRGVQKVASCNIWHGVNELRADGGAVKLHTSSIFSVMRPTTETGYPARFDSVDDQVEALADAALQQNALAMRNGLGNEILAVVALSEEGVFVRSTLACPV